MATELNLNTLNWVTLACPDCAAEVQVLEDDVQSELIRCPGCGEAIVNGDAEHELPAAEHPEKDPPIEVSRKERDGSAKPSKVRGENTQSEVLVSEESKAVAASVAGSEDGVTELLSGLPDLDDSGVARQSERDSGNNASADESAKHERAHGKPADRAVAESLSDHAASDQSVVVEPASDVSSDGEQSEDESAQDPDEAPAESHSAEQETVPDEELDGSELTQDASKDETVVAESPPPLPHSQDESSAENDLPVLDLTEETEEEDLSLIHI